jgi:hypothetical protein
MVQAASSSTKYKGCKLAPWEHRKRSKSELSLSVSAQLHLIINIIIIIFFPIRDKEHVNACVGGPTTWKLLRIFDEKIFAGYYYYTPQMNNNGELLVQGRLLGCRSSLISAASRCFNA